LSLVRQVLGSFAEFEKTTLVAKLAAARRQKRQANGKCEGRKPLAETHPEAVAMARKLAAVRKRKPSLRAISAALANAGCLNERGAPFNPASVAKMIAK
jgi:hypothetical protein